MVYGGNITSVTPNNDLEFWKNYRLLRITKDEHHGNYATHLAFLNHFISTSAADYPEVSPYRFKHFFIRETVLVHGLIVLCMHWLHAVEITNACGTSLRFAAPRPPKSTTALTNATKLLSKFLEAFFSVLEALLRHPLCTQFTANPRAAAEFVATAHRDEISKALMINAQAFLVAVSNSRKLRLIGGPNPDATSPVHLSKIFGIDVFGITHTSYSHRLPSTIYFSRLLGFGANLHAASNRPL